MLGKLMLDGRKIWPFDATVQQILCIAKMNIKINLKLVLVKIKLYSHVVKKGSLKLWKYSS